MNPHVDDHAKGFPDSRDRLLKVFLRLVGVADLMAVIVVFLPTAWLGEAHETIGLGVLPEGQIVGYLARSTSLLYGIHGALLIVMSNDLSNYRPLIRCYGRILVVAGLLLVGVDVAESMPVWWTVFESVAVIGIGVVILTLCHNVGPSKHASDSSADDRSA